MYVMRLITMMLKNARKTDMSFLFFYSRFFSWMGNLLKKKK